MLTLKRVVRVPKVTPIGDNEIPRIDDVSRVACVVKNPLRIGPVGLVTRSVLRVAANEQNVSIVCQRTAQLPHDASHLLRLVVLNRPARRDGVVSTRDVSDKTNPTDAVFIGNARLILFHSLVAIETPYIETTKPNQAWQCRVPGTEVQNAGAIVFAMRVTQSLHHPRISQPVGSLQFL